MTSSTLTSAVKDAAANMPSVLEALRTAHSNLRLLQGQETIPAMANHGGVMEPEAVVYEFGDWSTCTCGHIYLAAVGYVGDTMDVIGANPDMGFEPDDPDGIRVYDDLYEMTLEAVLKYNNTTPERQEATFLSGYAPHAAVSSLTSVITQEIEEAGGDGLYFLEASIQMLEAAIAGVEAEQVEAMKAMQSKTPPVRRGTKAQAKVDVPA